jgi:hypothetical protein
MISGNPIRATRSVAISHPLGGVRRRAHALGEVQSGLEAIGFVPHLPGGSWFRMRHAYWRFPICWVRYRVNKGLRLLPETDSGTMLITSVRADWKLEFPVPVGKYGHYNLRTEGDINGPNEE